jgi:hypothetical protein
MKYSNHDWFTDLLIFVAVLIMFIIGYMYLVPRIGAWFLNLLALSV